MGFVDDDGKAFVLGVDGDRLALFFEGFDRLGNEGKFLDGGDDDGGAVGEGFGELLGVLVDFLDDSGFVLELVDGVLKLLVEDEAIGDDDDGVEDAGVVAVVEAGEAMGEPCDRVGFAGACGVLNEVVVAGALGLGVVDEATDGVELVVAGEDEGFFDVPFGSCGGGEGGFFGFQVHEAGEDVEEAVSGEDFVPEVAGADVVGNRGIACAVVVAAIEGQEGGGGAFELGGHDDGIGIGSEVDKAAFFEGEEGFFGVAVLVLLADVLGGLAAHRVFEFDADDRETIKREDNVGDCSCGSADLAGDGEAVLVVAGEGFGGEVGVGGEVGEADGFAEAFEALAEDAECAFAVEFFGEAVYEDGLGLSLVGLGEALPDLGLGGLDEGEEVLGEEGEFGVVVLGIADRIAVGDEGLFDFVFKVDFFVHGESRTGWGSR